MARGNAGRQAARNAVHDRLRGCDRPAAAASHPGAGAPLLLGGFRQPRGRADVAKGVAARLHGRSRRRTRRLLRIPLWPLLGTRSSAPTTASCAPSRTCAGIEEIHCARESGSDLRELRCGYHGWTWDLAGALRRVPNRKGFGSLRLAELPLFAVRVDTWERLVFVNLDTDAIPLRDYLEAVPHDIAWNRLGDFRCYATMTIEVDANWKTIADGFSETYHIQTLHPELHRCMDDVYAPQTIWGHTGKSEQLYGVPSPRSRKT